MAPIKSPEKIKGVFTFTAVMGWMLSNLEALVKKAPYKERDTKAADPMANPFPMAAVVFPAASKASVLYLTYSPKSAISVNPPALSEIGPYPSIASPTARVDNIPKAPRAIPNIPKRV